MTVHTASETLVVAELSAAENLEREELRGLIDGALKERGLSPWSSMELEIFQGMRETLVLAVPVKVLLPECLLRLAELGGDT